MGKQDVTSAKLETVDFNTTSDNIIGFSGKIVTDKSGRRYLSQIDFITNSSYCHLFSFKKFIIYCSVGLITLFIVVFMAKLISHRAFRRKVRNILRCKKDRNVH